MFLFNSNHGNDPISFPDHPFFHFPSPNFDDQDLLLQQPQYSILLHHQHHYHQQQQQHQPLDETPATFLNLNMVDSEYSDMINNNVSGIHDNSTGREQQIQRKMSSSKTKRDRHSKINTLRGPRDRRMRLSLPVAREFFGLQDMLGVDKASKTVEWLILQAKHAISKLSREQSCHDGSGDGEGGSAAARSTSSISDSEVVSGIDETVIGKGNKRGGYQKSTTAKEKRGRLTRKTAFHPLARECREKARARARARTQEKQQLQITQNLNEPKPMDHHHHHLESTKQDLSKITSSWSTQIETGEESAGTHIEDQRMFDDQDHDSLMIMGRWSPSNSINQSLHNNNGIPQENPFGDLQFFGKPWEAYNTHGIC